MTAAGLLLHRSLSSNRARIRAAVFAYLRGDSQASMLPVPIRQRVRAMPMMGPATEE